ncbi:hypothetical protein Caci_8959 [Catenulispora acidiphila DSM 44928]|uniref:Uncharacterized protein n=1 Tax=Catenulispora acidiphila (strain DSM 44928 / JCM 14897 / NBRC 102108 / NRRL B-24433 / ID139908) TaxID=479433 RepID=C7Q414_CATAD|nr:hypothetical protein [Catenulispora acidiphila]ACU77772.1 hypothetical protein Caci_8959 [Catenulispora acidiphila DSM 44928]
MSFAMNDASAALRRRPQRIQTSPIAQAADIACDIADVLTRLNDNDIPELDTAANHLREAARLVRPHIPAATTASHRYRHTVRGIARRLREL